MNDKIKYTADDIRLYLEGKMSPAQMHALEKAALSDPFLADALEGISVHGDEKKFNTDVEELHTRLSARVNKRKGVLVAANNLWWKVAAVLFIVVSGVAIIILTGQNNNSVNHEIAKTENKRDSEINRMEKDEEVEKPEATEKTNGDLKTEDAKKDLTREKIEQKNLRAGTKKSVAANKIDSEKTMRSDEANIQDEIAASKPSAAVVPAPDSVSKAEEMAPPETQNQANVSKQLEGKAAGVKVARPEDNDAVFDEVIVIGNGNTRKNNNKSKTLSAGRAENRVIPGNGWDEFESYIENSTKINTADSVFTGEEYLSFTIGDDGLPESIKILRSISPSHDKEAIRLLENGPSWKVVKGRKREIRLKIVF